MASPIEICISFASRCGPSLLPLVLDPPRLNPDGTGLHNLLTVGPLLPGIISSLGYNAVDSILDAAVEYGKPMKDFPSDTQKNDVLKKNLHTDAIRKIILSFAFMTYPYIDQLQSIEPQIANASLGIMAYGIVYTLIKVGKLRIPLGLPVRNK